MRERTRRPCTCLTAGPNLRPMADQTECPRSVFFWLRDGQLLTAATTRRRCRRVETGDRRPNSDLAALAQQQGGLSVQPAEVVVSGAGALRGHHARANRRFGCAGGAEHLALPRLDDTLEHLAALACLGVGDPHSWHLELALRVELRVVGMHLQGALRDESQSAPFEVRPQLERLGHQLQRLGVALGTDHPGVLVLDLAAPLANLL